MSKQIDQALTLALKNLITQITRNGELTKFAGVMQRRKQYDQCEKQYVENQRLRKQLGNQYESSDSEQEKENYFNKMSQFQLKKMMRKNLIDKHFDEETLELITDPQQHEQQDELTTVKLLEEPSSSNDIRGECTELNIIKEAKEIVEEEVQRQTNFGLQFLIKELEMIQRNNSAIVS